MKITQNKSGFLATMLILVFEMPGYVVQWC